MDQQQQPQWSPPPQQPMGWGGAGYGGPVARPLGVTLTAVWFYFIGVVLILAAAFALAGTQFVNSYLGGALGGFAAGLGIILAVVLGLFAVLYILMGWGVWTGRGWGRIGGIVLAVIGVLSGLSSLTGDSIAFGVVSIAIWAGVIYALWMGASYFAARR